MAKIPQILIIEDEQVTRSTLKNLFVAEGCNVFLIDNGDKMEDILKEENIDLIIMDINLPGKNGLLLARELRERNEDIALIFLTGRDDEIDKILGLEIGADDYITKPFNPRELTIRARNLLTRTMSSSTETKDKSDTSSVNYFEFNGWKLDINSRSLITPDGQAIKLPRSEFRALQHFCLNPGKIHTRETLLHYMTGRELKEHDRTVDVTIRRIRKQFEEYGETTEIISTLHGEGYRFCIDVSSH